MNDGTLALIGVSLGVGYFAGWTMALAWRKRTPTRDEQLVRKVYRHLDDIIGATKHENQLRADKRFRVIHKRRWYWWLVPEEWPRTRRNPKGPQYRSRLANYFWPMPRIGPGVNPIPSDKRIAWYVQISPDHRTYSIRYSPEAAAQYDQFIGYLTRGTPTKGGGLAQALGREWTPDLFEVERNWADGLVRLTLAKPVAAVPNSLDLHEELNGA